MTVCYGRGAHLNAVDRLVWHLVRHVCDGADVVESGELLLSLLGTAVVERDDGDARLERHCKLGCIAVFQRYGGHTLDSGCWQAINRCALSSSPADWAHTLAAAKSDSSFDGGKRS